MPNGNNYAVQSAMIWLERFGGLGLLAGVLYFVFIHLIPIQSQTFERALEKQATMFEKVLTEQRQDFTDTLKEMKMGGTK